MERTVDLRSDTVTRPTAGMRRAMAEAEVGDDVFGEDPTVLALQERVAGLLGKEAALFVPSGTMANQVALLLLTRRGDEVLVGEGTHCAWYETGAAAVLAGVQCVSLGEGGHFTPEQLRAARKPSADWYPRSSVVVVENTHNRGGGRVMPLDRVRALVAEARSLGLALHLDGARLWNASAAAGVTVERFAEGFDTVSVCLSKGLGAPVGSVLASTRERIAEARRWRKRLGGGMRQVGVLAAAGLYALEHHRERLVEDHTRARSLATQLGGLPGLRVGAPESNIVMVDLPEPVRAEALAERLAARGVRCSVFGERRLRLVTHLEVDDEGCARAVRAFEAELRGA